MGVVLALQELLKPKSKEAILQEMLNDLAAQGFTPDAWQAGGDVRTMLEADAHTLASLYANVPVIARGGFVGLAESAWLDLLAEQRYGITRKPSAIAKYRLTLRCEAGSGPYTFQANELWVANAAGLRFNNIQGGTIAQGGTLLLDFVAVEAGAKYNLPTGTITKLITPRSGLSISNGADALLRAGADTETDTALRQRIKASWAKRFPSFTVRDTYKAYAVQFPAVTKVKVLEHPRGQGTIDVVIWGDGGIGADVVAEVRAFITNPDNRSINDDVQVHAATARTVTFNAVLQGNAAYKTTALAEASKLIAQYQQSLSIGETVYKAQIIEHLMTPQGVDNVILGLPADVYVGDREAVVFAPTLTFTELPA